MCSVQYQRRKGRNLEYLQAEENLFLLPAFFFFFSFPCSGRHVPSSSFLAGTSGFLLIPGAPEVNPWLVPNWGDLFGSGDPFCYNINIPLQQASRSQLFMEKNFILSLLRFWGSPCVLSGTWYGGPSVSWKRERKHLWYKMYTGLYARMLSVSQTPWISKVFFSMYLQQ